MLGTPIPFQVPNVQLPVVSLSCTYGAIRLTLFMSKVFKSGLFKCTSKCCKNKVKIKRHEVEKKEKGKRKTVVSDAIREKVEEKVKEKVEEKIEEVKEQVLVKVDEKLQEGIDSLKNSSTEIVEKTIEKTVEINPSNNNTMIADKTKDDIQLAEITEDDVLTNSTEKVAEKTEDSDNHEVLILPSDDEDDEDDKNIKTETVEETTKDEVDIKLAEINEDDVFTENNASVIAVPATTDTSNTEDARTSVDEQIRDWDFDTPPEGQTKTRAHGNSLIRQKTSEQYADI